jgi:hypothetical protein
MTTILKSNENIARNDRKVAILDVVALTFSLTYNLRATFQLVVLSPVIKDALPKDGAKKILDLIEKGAEPKDIFAEFGIFNEFELEYVQIAFNSGEAPKALEKLSNNLKDYYVH